MSYVIFNTPKTRSLMIHKDTCTYYRNRKATKTEWIECTSLAEADAKAVALGKAEPTYCQKCDPAGLKAEMNKPRKGEAA